MIFVNGCSFSRGPRSWPYFLGQLAQSDIWNLALAGAGNNYIKSSTIEDLQNQNPILFRHLNLDHIYNKENLHDIAKDNRWLDTDGMHRILVQRPTRHGQMGYTNGLIGLNCNEFMH